MKKMIFLAILFPLFAGAQTSWDTELDSDLYTGEQITTASEMSVDVAGRRHKTPRCGRHSDFKCSQHRVFETCERDNSHGIYGSCRDIGQRDGEIICSCR